MLDRLASNDVACVYLRGYEGLPDQVGHDVDLLVGRGMRKAVLAHIRLAARESGWKVVRAVEFSPLAVFLTDSEHEHLLHIDLFDRIERHWLSFGSASRILQQSFSNGLVVRPSVGDEVFLNVCTRLIYQGIVREKHKLQVRAAVAEGHRDEIEEAFKCHLGRRLGRTLAERVCNGDWETVGSMAGTLRWGSLLRWAIGAPLNAIEGLGRYIGRTLRRLFRPPGPFVVFLGADGVGKSSVINQMMPFMEELTGLNDSILFHWKPQKASVSIGRVTGGTPQDPRARNVRNPFLSLLFLGYHLLGFWVGWARWLFPPASRSRAVVGDRYALDIFLDPRRFRLNLPDWLLYLATRLVPRPGLEIALVADPNVIVERKAELPITEIEDYQERLRFAAGLSKRIRFVDAGQSLEQVCAEVRDAVINQYQERVTGE